MVVTLASLVKILRSKGLRQLIRLISALNNGVNRYLFVFTKFAPSTVPLFEYKVHQFNAVEIYESSWGNLFVRVLYIEGFLQF